MSAIANNLSHRVLVIDDNEGIHEDIRKIINQDRILDTDLIKVEAVLFGDSPNSPEIAQFEVDSAFQGREGTDKVQWACRDKNPYSVAIVDLHMPPGWDGMKTIENIWRVDPHIHIVICTGFGNCRWDEVRNRLGRNKQLLVLKKPVDNIEFFHAISSLTKSWEEKRQVRIAMQGLQSKLSKRDCIQEEEERKKRELYTIVPKSIT